MWCLLSTRVTFIVIETNKYTVQYECLWQMLKFQFPFHIHFISIDREFG